MPTGATVTATYRIARGISPPAPVAFSFLVDAAIPSNPGTLCTGAAASSKVTSIRRFFVVRHIQTTLLASKLHTGVLQHVCKVVVLTDTAFPRVHVRRCGMQKQPVVALPSKRRMPMLEMTDSLLWHFMRTSTQAHVSTCIHQIA